MEGRGDTAREVPGEEARRFLAVCLPSFRGHVSPGSSYQGR